MLDRQMQNDIREIKKAVNDLPTAYQLDKKFKEIFNELKNINRDISNLERKVNTIEQKVRQIK